MKYDVKDLKLAPKGKLKIEWAARQMPVLALIKRRFKKERPLQGIVIAACMHATSETANLMSTLKAGGAKVVLYNTNPLSTQDEVAASLAKDFQIPTFAIKGMPKTKYRKYVDTVLDYRPHITLDDGADLVATIHKRRRDLIPHIIGGTEETTTGVIRLRSLEKKGLLRYPEVAVNDAKTKFLFDNRYGTGQSTIDGILRATNVLLAGKKFVVCGFGWCARGIAMRARGMGANVIVTEVDPLRGLEALMEGYQVMPLKLAAKIGDIFVTSTGDIKVIDKQHLKIMKDGVILANAGHFNVEINLEALKKTTVKTRRLRSMMDEYQLKDGRRLYLLGEGRLVNLTAAEGHPAQVMDLSFANQALVAEYLVANRGKLKPKVYEVPKKIDREIARLKLKTMGVKIDKLTKEQRQYLAGWEAGAFG